jgi:hypothetical protein
MNVDWRCFGIAFFLASGQCARFGLCQNWNEAFKMTQMVCSGHGSLSSDREAQ